MLLTANDVMDPNPSGSEYFLCSKTGSRLVWGGRGVIQLVSTCFIRLSDNAFPYRHFFSYLVFVN